MRNHRYTCVFLILCLAALMLSGCGERKVEIQDADMASGPYAGVVSMEKEPVTDYSVPELLPNVLVDERGYCVGDGKLAGIKGGELPEEFGLIDAYTGEEVYRGSVSRTAYHSESGLYSGYADFSAFDESGIYYLECDKIGRSVCFPIGDSLYAALFEETYREMLDRCGQRTLTLPEAVDLLEVYEWYPDIFPDQDGDETADVLKELRGWVSYMEESGGGEGRETLYAAFLAKFSYVYRKFDLKYATDCLKRASTVFGQAEYAAARNINDTNVNSVGIDDAAADRFFALTELYRATGNYTYQQHILNAKSLFADSSYLERRSVLHAVMTYIATRQRVDVELCESFMGSLMDEAEETSKHSADIVHPVAPENDGEKNLLETAVKLSCANYIMNNYQYTETMGDFLHYLMGLNRESVSFYENGEERSSYLLLAAQLTVLHGKEGQESRP